MEKIYVTGEERTIWKWCRLEDISTWKSGVHFVLTDETIYRIHRNIFPERGTIVVPEGEQSKSFSQAELIVDQLIDSGAMRDAVLYCVGGGVITDLGGFVASIYMRGIKTVYVPTTLLALTDAALGGKTALNTRLLKNVAGTVRQPSEIWNIPELLESLPANEWINGMAEVVKHALLGNGILKALLQKHTLHHFQQDKTLLRQLIEMNASQKMEVVKQDPFEKKLRKTLNLGHTLGHAIEKLYALKHGFAVSIGICFASFLSDKVYGTSVLAEARLLLSGFGLPTNYLLDPKLCIERMKGDKKSAEGGIDFILPRPGAPAEIRRFSLEELEKALELFTKTNDH